MYRLATTHSVTDRQTDRRQYHANSRPYLAKTEQTRIQCLSSGRHIFPVYITSTVVGRRHVYCPEYLVLVSEH